MRKSILTLTIALPVLTGLAFGGYSLFGDKLAGLLAAAPGAGGGGGWAPPPSLVAVVTVKPETLPRTLKGIGTLEAAQKVDLASEVSGRIAAIVFSSGQKVRRGDVIIRLSDATEKAELSRMRVKLALAEKQLKRANSLKGVAVSQSFIDEARSTRDELRAQISSTQVLLRKKTITAPFDGTLGIRKVNPGQYLQPGDAIVSITDLSRFHVNFELPEKATAWLKTGQVIRVMVDALPDRELTARVSTIEPQVEKGLHTVLVQGELEAPPAGLRSGMFAELRVITGEDTRVVMVPETAVERSTYGNTVYIIKQGKDKALSAGTVSVRMGAVVQGRVVIAEGLKAGQKVIISGQNRLFPGAPVVVKSARASIDMTGEKMSEPGKMR